MNCCHHSKCFCSPGAWRPEPTYSSRGSWFRTTHPGAAWDDPSRPTPHQTQTLVLNMCALAIFQSCMRSEASLELVILFDAIRWHRSHCWQRIWSTFERHESGTFVAQLALPSSLLPPTHSSPPPPASPMLVLASYFA